MYADAFRHLYKYHFAENRKMRDHYLSQLSSEQFTQEVAYSHGSVRDQILHLISVDDAWFSDLSGTEFLETLDPADYREPTSTHAIWDGVEQKVRAYLDALRDDMLYDKPLEGEDKDLLLWQVLLHVANHGTDHRAQLLRLLHDLGVETTAQDYIFFVYEHP